MYQKRKRNLSTEEVDSVLRKYYGYVHVLWIQKIWLGVVTLSFLGIIALT